MIRKLALASTALVALSACSISSNPVQDVLSGAGSLAPGLQTGIATDIQDAQFNLNSAVTVGALSSSDPAPGCLNSIVTLTGLGGVGPVTASFVPKVGGPASLASVAYIRLQQANGLGGNISAQIPVTCLALIGKLNVDGLQQLNKAAISAIPIPGVSGVLNSLPIPLGATGGVAPPPLPKGAGARSARLNAPTGIVTAEMDNPSLGGK